MFTMGQESRLRARVALLLLLLATACADEGSEAGAAATPADEEAEEFARFVAKQAERSNDQPPANAAKAVEEEFASSTIWHGGTGGDDYREHLVGGPCPSGFLRTRVTATHRGHGWGGVGRESDSYARWVAPDDKRNCRARVWTKNPGAWFGGELDWVIFMEKAEAGHLDFCRFFGPCRAGKGDCDSDSECQSGLTCTDDVGPEFGFGRTVDVCTPDLPNGHPDYCRLMGRCEPGEGDCDSDAQCLPGLVCGNDNGADFGLDSWVDACR